MANANTLLSYAELGQVEERIAQIESEDTAAEIVCAVATESGRYDRGEAIVGLLTALVALAVVNFGPLTPEDGNSWVESSGASFLVQSVAVAVGFSLGMLAASYFHGLRAALVSAKEVNEEVDRSAQLVFMDAILSSPRTAGAVLIYISLAERQARILCDEQVATVLNGEKLNVIRDVVVEKLAAKDPLAALMGGVQSVADHLKDDIPAAKNDRDELQNHIRIIHPRP